MKNQKSNLIPQTNWISVKDGLPEIGQKVVYYCTRDNDPHVTCYTKTLGFKNSSTDKWEVTYWLLLPQLPVIDHNF